MILIFTNFSSTSIYTWTCSITWLPFCTRLTCIFYSINTFESY